MNNKFNHIYTNTYIENPTCSICGSRISHEWLAGDYTMLVCSKEECFDEWSLKRLEDQRKHRLQNAVNEVLQILEGKK